MKENNVEENKTNAGTSLNDDTDAADESSPGEATSGENQQLLQQLQQQPRDDGTPAPQNDDYDTEATESELALSEPGASSPSPPVHDEFTEHRDARN